MINVGEILLNLWQGSGFNAIFSGFTAGGWQNLVMLIIACVLLYLGIVKKFEPLLLVGIAFGCLLSNLPLGGLYHQELWDAFMDPTNAAFHSYGAIMREGGLLDIFSAVMGLILAMAGTCCLLLLISTVCFMRGMS